MFEHRNEPLLTRRKFFGRLVRCALLGSGLIALSLLVGVIGYHDFGGLSWIDAFVNASMLLGGMGPVDAMHSTGAKLFASFYALYCGLTVLAIAGIFFAPVVHRFLHRFHLEQGRSD